VKSEIQNKSISFDAITPAIKFLEFGHVAYRRIGISAAARRNHPFNEPSRGSKPASNVS
jgi:hypothetical protein